MIVPNFRKILKHIAYAAFLIFIGSIIVVIYPFELSQKNVTIVGFNRHYACGECEYRFGISEVLDERGNKKNKDNSQDSPFRFDGWDILVLFKGSSGYLSSYEDRVDLNKAGCAKPDFRLRGQFKRRLIYSFMYADGHYDGIYFEADTGKALNPIWPSCKEMPKEVVLQ
jgi:hypothetical protein